MSKLKTKVEHYSQLKMLLRIVTLIIAVWALIIAYQAKNIATWVDDKQEHVLNKLLWKEN